MLIHWLLPPTLQQLDSMYNMKISSPYYDPEYRLLQGGGSTQLICLFRLLCFITQDTSGFGDFGVRAPGRAGVGVTVRSGPFRLRAEGSESFRLSSPHA